MKRILTCIALFLLLPAALKAEALFEGSVEPGWYAGPQVKMSALHKEFAVFLGVEGAILADGYWGMGMGMYMLTTSHELMYAKTDTARDVHVMYGGLKFTHIAAPDYLIHPTFGLLIGMGNVKTPKSEWVVGRHYYHYDWDNDLVFALEPEVGAELNILSNLRLNASVSYRVLTGYESRYKFTSTDLSGLTGTISLKFGKMDAAPKRKQPWW